MSTLSFFPAGAPAKRAIAYYRHSAEDKQENSVSIQQELIRAFAQTHDIQIIHEVADEGETGLLAERSGFQRLFTEWILNEHAPAFEYVLVRDVDRWARFQNPNEWGYYEFLCNKRGKKVIDVSIGFPREDRPLANNILMLIKREMAAEYSRQLSEKVFHGCMFVSRQGFSAGGSACYGMGRLLLNEQREPIDFLKRGEHKQIANQRVKFVPLEDHTTATVREMFLLADQGHYIKSIASVLNARGIPSACGGKWNGKKVRRVLKNEIYTGKRIYNKTWNRLRQGRRRNPRSAWVVREQDFPAVVCIDVFNRVQKNLIREERVIMRKKNGLKEKFLGDLRHFLSLRGKSAKSVKTFPVIVSHALAGVRERRWCFCLSRALWRHDHVVCIGTGSEEKDSTEKCFLIPTQDFGCAGVRVLREGKMDDQRYALTQDKFAEKVLEIAENIHVHLPLSTRPS